MTTREDEIRARLNSITTKLDWKWSDARMVYGKYDYVPQGSCLSDTLIMMGDTYEGHEDDAWFIANAPCDVEYLLRENQRLQNELLKVRLVIDMNESQQQKRTRYHKALEQIETLTRNPREYQPLYSTLNHIARQALDGDTP